MMVKTLRENRGAPDVLARCLLRQIKTLEDKGILAASNLDEEVVLSLAIQGLFHHRSGSASHNLEKSTQASSIPVSPASSEDDFVSMTSTSTYQVNTSFNGVHNDYDFRTQAMGERPKSYHVSNSMHQALQFPGSVGATTEPLQNEAATLSPTSCATDGPPQGRDDLNAMQFSSNLHLNDWHARRHDFGVGIENASNLGFNTGIDHRLWNNASNLRLSEPQPLLNGLCLDFRD